MADLTTQILIEIRDEARKTNQRINQTNERLDQAIHRLDRLERRQVEAEVRISTEIVGVHGAISELTDVMRVGARGWRARRGPRASSDATRAEELNGKGCRYAPCTAKVHGDVDAREVNGRWLAGTRGVTLARRRPPV